MVVLFMSAQQGVVLVVYSFPFLFLLGIEMARTRRFI